MDWFLYDNGLRHERFNFLLIRIVKQNSIKVEVSRRSPLETFIYKRFYDICQVFVIG